MKKCHLHIIQIYSCLALFVCIGCDPLYNLLQREGAQEKNLLGDTTLGVHNPVVEEIQALLKLYGYAPGKIDGKMGLKTRNAIEQFQIDHNLKETRFADRRTWAALNLFDESNLVFIGEVDIETVQLILSSAGFDPGKIDGKPGLRTIKAIKEFQEANGLKPDGKIGYRTLSALASYAPAR